MKKACWWKYLSMVMTMVLMISMMPVQGVFASEEGKGKTVISSFDVLPVLENTSFPQGTKEEDLGLPKEVTAYDEAGNPITLTDVVWKVKAKSDETDEEVKAEKYSDSLAAGEYVFLLSPGKGYKLADGVERPKFYITITEPQTETAETNTETAETTTETVETNTEVVETIPETAETNTETAETSTETLETNTETPETNTETVETNTETPETNTETVETNTETAETNTETLETNTETVETNTETVETASETSETNTETAETTTETAETNTETVETNTETTEIPQTETDPSAELGAEGSLGEAPMIDLVIPESMEVGKTYQLQYSISDENLAQAGVASVSYQAVEGSENIEMPDQSGNFTVVNPGTVTFQVNVALENGTELQAMKSGNTVPDPANSVPSEETQETETVETSSSEIPLNEEPVPDLNDPAAQSDDPNASGQDSAPASDRTGQQLQIPTFPSAMSVGDTIDLGTSYQVVDANQNPVTDVPTEGISLSYSIQNVEPADTAIASLNGTSLTASGAGKFNLTAQLVQTNADGTTTVLLETSREVTVSNWYDGLHMELTGLPAEYRIGDEIALNSAQFVLKNADGAVVNAPDGTTLSYQVDNNQVASLESNNTILKINNAGTFNLTVTVSGTTIQAVVTATVKSNEKQILTFTLDGRQVSRPDGVTNLSVTLPCSTDLTKVVPEITISDNATINGVSAKQISGKAADFSKAVQYTITAEDGTSTTYTVTVTKERHDYDEITVAATCTKAGESYQQCKVCGDVKNRKTIKKLGHNWGEWKTTKEPTTTSKGQQTRTCSRCKETETREIQRLNIVAQASQNVIWGFASPAKYPVNSTITFEAIGDGTDNESPIKGDTRFIPTSTWNLVNDYQWGNNGYTATFKITKAGTYTLTVTFQEQEYDGSQWVNTGTTSQTQQQFVIEGTGSYTDSNGNGTGNTKNPDQVVNGTTPVKTGDTSPIMILIVVLVIAAVVLVAAIVYRKKRQDK